MEIKDKLNVIAKWDKDEPLKKYDRFIIINKQHSFFAEICRVWENQEGDSLYFILEGSSWDRANTFLVKREQTLKVPKSHVGDSWSR